MTTMTLTPQPVHPDLALIFGADALPMTSERATWLALATGQQGLLGLPVTRPPTRGQSPRHGIFGRRTTR